MSLLPALVDTAVREVRMHTYEVPPHLVEPLDMAQKQGICTRARHLHPWINLERRIWSLLPSAVWTDDPDQATIHVVPHAYMDHHCINNAKLSRRYLKEGLVEMLKYIVYAQPYYNRSGGHDHVVVSLFENGPLCDCTMRMALADDNYSWAFGVFMSMMKVGHWAHHDQLMYGWRAGFDIAMPQFGSVPESFGPFPPAPPRSTWQEIVQQKRTSFGFSGSYWGTAVTCDAIDKSKPPDSLFAAHTCGCSSGVRGYLKGYMSKSCNSINATPTSRCSGMSAAMGSFWYALCPAAWACWSSRLYHAIDRVVVPVIMANGAIQPFEDLLDWHSFSVTLDTDPMVTNHSAAQLEALHEGADDVRFFCADCPTCTNCTRLPLVKRLRALEQVRSWFLYNGTWPYNVMGLFVLELHCRQVHLKRDGDAVCKRYHAHQHALRGRSESGIGRLHKQVAQAPSW